MWPSVSPDGAKIADLSIDLANNYESKRILADADGSNPIEMVPPGTFLAVDAHLFSPDRTRMSFTGARGVYVMNPDGTGLTMISTSGGHLTLDWTDR